MKVNVSEPRVEVLWLAESGYHENSTLLEHTHTDYFQVYYILEGSGTFLANHAPIKFTSGMFFFLMPGISHGIESVNVKEPDIVRIAEIKFAVLDPNFSDLLSKLPIACRGTKLLEDLFYQTFLESIQRDMYYENVVASMFTIWLYQVMRFHKNYNQNRGKPKPAVLIKQYLEQHYAEEFSLDILSQATGYSKNYLCRIFCENTGTTIASYLNEVRVSHAADLLTHTDLDVAEVGRRCGYNSVHYFIKTFKKLIGVPPGGYRKSELTGVALVTGTVDSISASMRSSESMLRLENKDV